MNLYKISLLVAVFFMLNSYAYSQLVDPLATRQTRNLYRHLLSMNKKEMMIGHQDDLAYGVGWKYEKDRSDIKDLTGNYPSVFGWDVAGIENQDKLNLDGIPFEKMKAFIVKAYDMGAVNTLSWHMPNPVSGKNAWDTTSGALSSLLPGNKNHKLYRRWLDRFAAFSSSLRGTDGQAIPILFRPLHEHSGGWFWWGAKSCSPQEYKTLWMFTVNYLRKTRKLHNLIYVFNPCDFDNQEQYLERYPGDDFVDVLSFDAYQYGGIGKNDFFKADLSKKLAIQARIAESRNKPAALAETGFVEIPDPNWWTDTFAPAVQSDIPAYVLFWRNAGYRPIEKDNHYYAPYPGQQSAQDFIRFLNHKMIIMQPQAQSKRLYE
ncbi:glycoside hydrolase family 26 protein [Pedobacter jeongneungensis]|uniref:glycoside hydrolase family 26 protein n=1 Tax=Pedobacter jeongneungensis TaxID=947309 RepID=UPI00046ACF9A|nr:glycosyl hydrolase [Pedobacter jeongneungensis]